MKVTLVRCFLRCTGSKTWLTLNVRTTTTAPTSSLTFSPARVAFAWTLILWAHLRGRVGLYGAHPFMWSRVRGRLWLKRILSMHRTLWRRPGACWLRSITPSLSLSLPHALTHLLFSLLHLLTHPFAHSRPLTPSFAPFLTLSHPISSLTPYHLSLHITHSLTHFPGRGEGPRSSEEARGRSRGRGNPRGASRGRGEGQHDGHGASSRRVESIRGRETPG